MRERTMAGLAASRARALVGGHRRALSAVQLAHAEALAAGGTPVREIAELLGAGRSTLYRALRERGTAKLAVKIPVSNGYFLRQIGCGAVSVNLDTIKPGR